MERSGRLTGELLLQQLEAALVFWRPRETTARREQRLAQFGEVGYKMADKVG